MLARFVTVFGVAETDGTFRWLNANNSAVNITPEDPPTNVSGCYEVPTDATRVMITPDAGLVILAGTTVQIAVTEGTKFAIWAHSAIS